MAFTQTVQKSRGGQVYLVHGGSDQTGQPAWYFVQVESAKANAFLKTVNAGSINLEKYGSIIESGYSKEPPYSIIEKMRAQYGYTG